MKTFILISTYHDPKFKLKEFLIPALPLIKELFPIRIVSLTPMTGNNNHILSFLDNNGYKAVICQSEKQVDAYKLTIKMGLEIIEGNNNKKLFYSDFDRLIHWMNTYPLELTKVLDANLDVEYLHLGRTARAFKTHPKTQIETEITVNEFGSKILGFPRTRDIISVCWIISKKLAENVLKIENLTATGFYGLWPVLFWKWATSKRYIEVEGNEWETPDRFSSEIKSIGFNEWMKNFQSHEEWEKRVRLMRECLEEMAQFTEFIFKSP
ncbi:MAG: hypothetical protein ACTSWY_05135 [Promethearchaeota archaeon]